jgi:hypothetical protein
MLTEAYDTDDMKNVSIIGWNESFKNGWADMKDDRGTYF